MTPRARLIASLVSAAILGIIAITLLIFGTGGPAAFYTCVALVAWNLFAAWRAWRSME